MKRFLGCTFSAMLTLIIGLSWYFTFNEGLVFGVFIVSIISSLKLFASPFLVYYISEYDKGRMDGGEVDRVFKNVHGRSLWLKVYNLLITSLQVILLVVSGWSVLAGVCLISNAVFGKLISSCGRRYSDHLSKK